MIFIRWPIRKPTPLANGTVICKTGLPICKTLVLANGSEQYDYGDLR